MVFDFIIYFVQTFCVNVWFFYQNRYSANSYDVANSHYCSLLHSLLLMFLICRGFLRISVLTQVIMIGNHHETPPAKILELLGNIRIFSFDLCCLIKMEILTLINMITILGLQHTQSWYLGHTWLVRIVTGLWLGPLGFASFGNVAGAFQSEIAVLYVFIFHFVFVAIWIIVGHAYFASELVNFDIVKIKWWECIDFTILCKCLDLNVIIYVFYSAFNVGIAFWFDPNILRIVILHCQSRYSWSTL